MKSQTIAILILAALATTARGQGLATGVNYNDTTPAAPTGAANIHWQHDSSRPTINTSAYASYPTVQVACPSSGDLKTPVQNAIAILPAALGGIVDARACQQATSWTGTTTITQPNLRLLLPCATLTATNPVTVAAGVRNVTVEGCSFQGASATSGLTGGTIWNFQGTGNAWQIGDPTYAQDTQGFQMLNLDIQTAYASSGAQAIHFYRTKEIRLDNLYLNGDQGTDMTGLTLDGTGDYSGGTFTDIVISGFNTALYLTGHLSGSVTDDYANASTFLKLHIDCPETAGSPTTGTTGIYIAGGDGNSFVGGDVEGCATVMHFGPNAVQNTVTGLRFETSNTQFLADSGSSFNQVLIGQTIYTGQLADNGSRNSWADSFHRSWNQLNGDWYASQADQTVTDHQRLGIGLGNERGRLTEIQTDWGYRWLNGYTDATAGAQSYEIQDLINNTYRLAVTQYNSGASSTNNQTALNSAGTGAVLFNTSTNSGTGGVVIGSGGPSPTQVWSVTDTGSTDQYGNLNFWSTGSENWEIEANSAASLTIQDASATTPARVFKANANGSTDVDSQATAAVTVNNTSTSGTGGLTVYGGGTTYYNTAVFNIQPNGSGGAYYKFPTIKAATGHYCAQLDDSGYLTNTGSPCGTSSSNGSVTSVALSAPSGFTVSGSPVTSSGTLAIGADSVGANLVAAGPSTGPPGTWTWRALTATDIPALNYDANGAAASAQSNAETYAQSVNTSGNAATATYASSAGAAPWSGLSGIPANFPGGATGNAATATKLNSNTLGCLDGWDHLPCTVAISTVPGVTAAVASPGTSYYTVPSGMAGIYRVSARAICTTASSSTATIYLYPHIFSTGQSGGYGGLTLDSAQIGASCSMNASYSYIYNLSAATSVYIYSTLTGSNTGGAWTQVVTVERLQ
jgi:hypothetical protein